jgi:hypothetical protein
MQDLGNPLIPSGRLDLGPTRCQYDGMNPGSHSARPLRAGSLAAIALSAAVLLAACGSSPSTTATTTSKTPKSKVTIPASATGSPALTVTNYLTALSHHDAATAKKYLYSKVRKVIVAASGSGFNNLTNLQNVKVLATASGAQYRPTISGVTLTKLTQFAQVTVSYTATFSSSTEPSGPQTKVVTVGDSSDKWLILAIKVS